MIRVEFDPPAQLMSMNDRSHWRTKAEQNRNWRFAAHLAARNAQARYLDPCTVTVILPVVGNRRRDPMNYFATVKPIIDGLVDAGCWPDDTPQWVTTTEPRLDPTTKLVTVELVPRPAAVVSAPRPVTRRGLPKHARIEAEVDRRNAGRQASYRKWHA